VSQVCSATDDGHVFLYHALSKPYTLCYIQPLDTVIVYDVQGEVLNIYDIVSPDEYKFQAVLGGLRLPDVTWIRLHFTPDLIGLSTQVIARDQRAFPFFVRGALPIRQPFRFPAMGET
jgi:hypothetical protein